MKPSEEEDDDDDEDEDEGGREEDVKRKGVEPVEEAEEDLDVVGCDMCPGTAARSVYSGKWGFEISRILIAILIFFLTQMISKLLQSS